MSVVLGIDIGGSTTKIVGTDGKKPIGMLQVRAADQITSMYGAIGNFLRSHKLKPADVSTVYLTGVGASLISEQVYGIDTVKVEEFLAMGTGALRLTGYKEALVVSMGTGTALVRATEDEVRHIGGTGIGGGTVIGLASHLLRRYDIDAILALAESGDLRNVDLLVGDILSADAGTLPLDLTASNFGNLKSTASDCDVALGIINMVFETIGMMAVLALKNDSIRKVILTGTLTTFPQAKPIFCTFSKLTGLEFIIPPQAVFATAFGTLPTP